MIRSTKTAVTRSFNTSATKPADVFGAFGVVRKVPAPLMDKQIVTIPWTDQGLLRNEYGAINKEAV